MENGLVRKCLIFWIVLLFIGVVVTPVIVNSETSITQGSKIWQMYGISIVNESKSEFIEDTNTTNWVQVIGDYPNGVLSNGFNNSCNVAVRGVTTFNVSNKECILFGTGNAIGSHASSARSNEIFLPLLTFLLTFGIKGFQFLYRSVMLDNQFNLNSIVSGINNTMQLIQSEGCELWYFDGYEWGQSIGNDTNAIIKSGFNNPNNTELSVLIPYHPKGVDTSTYLYAGTMNSKEGCEIWRTTDPINGIWEPIIEKTGNGTSSSGFGNHNNTAVFSSTVFKNWLYVGTLNVWNGCEIWRTNGTVWQKVIGGNPSDSNISNGFGDDDRGFERDLYAWEMKVYNDSSGEQLYVGTFNLAGCELWRTNNDMDWECLVGEKGFIGRGFNNKKLPIKTHNYGIRRMEIFNGSLFIGTASTPPFSVKLNGKFFLNPLNKEQFDFHFGNGCEIWRFNNSSLIRIIGGTRYDSNSSGFGDKNNVYIWSLKEFKGYLFAGTMNPGVSVLNISIKRQNLFFVKSNGTLDTNECKTFGNAGLEMWFTDKGTNWHQMIGDEINSNFSEWPMNGFGDGNNNGARTLTVYNDSIYLGIFNMIDGCEVWRFDGADYPDEPNGGGQIIT